MVALGVSWVLISCLYSVSSSCFYHSFVYSPNFNSKGENVQKALREDL